MIRKILKGVLFAELSVVWVGFEGDAQMVKLYVEGSRPLGVVSASAGNSRNPIAHNRNHLFDVDDRAKALLTALA
jgi:hypothetical protein